MTVNSQRHIFLIAEDEPLIALDIEDIVLRRSPGQVVFARRCDEIRRHLEAGAQFRAAILDIRLADGMSFDVARGLLAAGTGIVFATGDSLDLPADLAHCPAIGKPFGAADLEAALDRALGVAGVRT